MKRCSFCGDHAVWSFTTTQGTLLGGSSTVYFCRPHMMRYYLSVA